MTIVLENENGETYSLPEGFAIQGLDLARDMPNIEYTGKSYLGIDSSLVRDKKTTLSIEGKIIDCSSLWLTDAELARHEALETLREILAFCAQAGVLKIKRETTERIDTASLNWHIEAYLSKVNAKFINGAFNATVQQIGLEFTRINPYWQGDFNKVVASGSILSGSTLSLSVTNEGSVRAYPLIMLYSLSGFTIPTGKEIIVSAGVGKSVKWAGILAADSWLIFDTKTKQIFSVANIGKASEAEGLPNFNGDNGTGKMGSATDIDEWASQDWGIQTSATITITSSDDISANLDITAHSRFREQYY